MTPADIALARRAVAAPGWRWDIGGIFWHVDTERGPCPLCDGAGGFRWREADGSENGEQCPCAGRVELYPGFRNDGFHERMMQSGALPDLTDPTTLGAVLGMVRAWRSDPEWSLVRLYVDQRAEIYAFPGLGRRAAWGDSRAYHLWLLAFVAQWRTGVHPGPSPLHSTEAEALIAALEAPHV